MAFAGWTNFFGESWFLCGWTKDGTHLDYGVFDAASDPEDPEYENILDAEAQ